MLQAVGAHQATQDDDFQRKYRGFKAQVADIQRVGQAMQLWMEAYSALSLASSHLAESLSQLHPNYEINYPLDAACNIYSAVSRNINDVIKPAVLRSMQDRCIAPINAILALVPEIEDNYEERRKVMLDYDFYKSKIQGDGSSSRVGAKMQEKVKELVRLQELLDVSLNEFEDARHFLLGPEIAAFVGCAYYANAAAASVNAQAVQVLPQSASTITSLAVQTRLPPVPANVMGSASILEAQLSYQRIKFMKNNGVYYVAQPTYARPLVLGGMTGGYDLAPPFNKRIAEGFASHPLPSPDMTSIAESTSTREQSSKTSA